MRDGEPRRVLMTADTVGGVWNWALTLAGSLDARGIEVVLATLGGLPSAEQRAEAARIPGLELVAGEYKLEWMEDPWRDVVESGAWLLRLEREYGPDVVHLNSFGHGALEWRAPVVVTAHSCVCSWWSAVKRTPLGPEWEQYRAVVRRTLQAADFVTAPSRTMLYSLRVHYGGLLPPWRAIYNGATGLYRLPKEPFILTAGRLWDEGKNAAAVARVAPRLSWPVYLAGEFREAFGSCRMLGPLSSERLHEWFARASIYVLPARYEPFGLSALEAALSGCALVLGDIASLREIWRDAAVYVSPDDCGRLEALIEELIANPAQRIEMAQRARVRARVFTPDRMADAYLEAYQSAAASSRRMACAS